MIFDLAFKQARRLFRPRRLFLSVHMSRVEAGASTIVYEFDSVVTGQHIYKSVWMPLTDETHKLEDNKHGEYTINDRL